MAFFADESGFFNVCFLIFQGGVVTLSISAYGCSNDHGGTELVFYNIYALFVFSSYFLVLYLI